MPQSTMSPSPRPSTRQFPRSSTLQEPSNVLSPTRRSNRLQSPQPSLTRTFGSMNFSHLNGSSTKASGVEGASTTSGGPKSKPRAPRPRPYSTSAHLTSDWNELDGSSNRRATQSGSIMGRLDEEEVPRLPTSKSSFALARAAPNLRPHLRHSVSTTSLPRSGSEPSLLSNITKTLFSPISWLLTPSHAITTSRKRDSGFDQDLEDPESPIDQRASKRQRPSSPTDEYHPSSLRNTPVPRSRPHDPELPSLPPNVSLDRNFHDARTQYVNGHAGQSSTSNYLDPPLPDSWYTPTKGLGRSPLTRGTRKGRPDFGDGGDVHMAEFDGVMSPTARAQTPRRTGGRSAGAHSASPASRKRLSSTLTRGPSTRTSFLFSPTRDDVGTVSRAAKTASELDRTVRLLRTRSFNAYKHQRTLPNNSPFHNRQVTAPRENPFAPVSDRVVSGLSRSNTMSNLHHETQSKPVGGLFSRNSSAGFGKVGGTWFPEDREVPVNGYGHVSLNCFPSWTDNSSLMSVYSRRTESILPSICRWRSGSFYPNCG
jgi:hypothetical protein